MDAGRGAEAPVDHFAHIGVRVHRINQFGIASPGEQDEGVANSLKSVSKTLAAVGSHNDEFATRGGQRT